VSSESPPPSIDSTVAHPARRYNYWLGGKDHFAADRESGDAIAGTFPGIRTTVIENRLFLRRAVTHLVQEAGVRQFLDIGTGLPTADNTHEVAQRIAPESRVLYVDNDPLVMVHARALLTSAPQGATDYIQADLREPKTILAAPQLRDTLDLSQPVALMLIALLHFIGDEDQPEAIIRTLVDALPSGSYLVLSHASYDFLPPRTTESLNRPDNAAMQGFTMRTGQQIARFFDGLDLVEPGIVAISEWRGEDDRIRPPLAEVGGYAAVARKP
jgi:S-adenosyl methyltransferase